MKKHIKWLQYSASTILLIVLSIGFFNYKIDSLGLFGNSNYLNKAAKTLVSGQMIAGLVNYDERLFQELIIRNASIRNDVIVLGSSRCMPLRKRFFLQEKVNFFNHSVSGGSLEDDIAILGLYESIQGYLPSTIVLGVDPWIFNKYSAQKRWKSISDYYDYEIAKIYNKKINATVSINTSKWKQLINYDYTISNITFLKKSLKKKGKPFYITNSINIDAKIKEADGSIHYPFDTRYIKEDLVREEAIAYAKKPVYSIERFTKLNNVKLFEDFLKYLQSKDVKIIIILPSYNPITYDLLMVQAEYQIIDKVEKYLYDFANKNNIEIKGSYDPSIYKFKVTDFFDGMHGQEYVLKRLWE